jgi:hypothetical protein
MMGPDNWPVADISPTGNRLAVTWLVPGNPCGRVSQRCTQGALFDLSGVR